jgi:hypothetical protein
MPSSRWRTVLGSLFTILVLAICGCSSKDRAISSEEVRELGGSSQAVEARDAAEQRLRAAVRPYADHTALNLGLASVRDQCLGGEATRRFDPDGYDPYKIKCSLSISTYYGADPKRAGDVLNGILDEGDRPGSSIAFGHDHYRDRLVAYYRAQDVNPVGADADEPTQLSNTDQTLSWDPVLDRSPHRLVQERDACPDHDSPVLRCMLEPKSETVAAIRERYGMVFKLDLSAPDYYKVQKDGPV